MTVSRAFAAQVGLGQWLRELLKRLRERARARLGEIAGVGLGDAFLIGFGYRNGWFNIAHPNGYTKGWNVIGAAITQAQFGAFLIAFATLRLAAFLVGPWWSRAAFCLAGTFLALSVDIAVRKANPSAPTIPNQDALACLNLVMFALLYYRRLRRGP